MIRLWEGDIGGSWLSLLQLYLEKARGCIEKDLMILMRFTLPMVIYYLHMD